MTDMQTLKAKVQGRADCAELKLTFDGDLAFYSAQRMHLNRGAGVGSSTGIEMQTASLFFRRMRYLPGFLLGNQALSNKMSKVKMRAAVMSWIDDPSTYKHISDQLPSSPHPQSPDTISRSTTIASHYPGYIGCLQFSKLTLNLIFLESVWLWV